MTQATGQVVRVAIYLAANVATDTTLILIINPQGALQCPLPSQLASCSPGPNGTVTRVLPGSLEKKGEELPMDAISGH